MNKAPALHCLLPRTILFALKVGFGTFQWVEYKVHVVSSGDMKFSINLN